MPQPSSERRRSPRALADFPIQLKPQAGAGPAQLKDISEIGLCCEFGAAVEEMTLVAIDLQLPGQKGHQVKGAVVRCDPVPGKKNLFEIAIYFTEIGAPTKTALRTLVASGDPA